MPRRGHEERRKQREREREEQRWGLFAYGRLFVLMMFIFLNDDVHVFVKYLPFDFLHRCNEYQRMMFQLNSIGQRQHPTVPGRVNRPAMKREKETKRKNTLKRQSIKGIDNIVMIF